MLFCHLKRDNLFPISNFNTKNKILSMFIIIVMMVAMLQALAFATDLSYWTDEGYYDLSWYDDGKSLFEINTPQQLAGLAVLNNGIGDTTAVDFTGKTILLENGVDLSSKDWTPIGNPDRPFRGVFDGNNFSIENLIINLRYTSYVGLFGYNFGTIKNVGIVGTSNITGFDCVGNIAGYNDGTVINCYNTGNVAGDAFVGGVVGDNSYNAGTVSNCYNTGSVEGESHVGGVVGSSTGKATVTTCYNTGNITGIIYVGGIVGDNNGSAVVSDCHNTGSISGSSYNAGGIVGNNYAFIIDCYNMGNVFGINEVGGISGNNYGEIVSSYNTGVVNGGSYDVGGVIGVNRGWISNCYNLGSIIGTNDVGGVSGHNDGMAENCYNTGSISGTSYVGGVIGYNSDSVDNCYFLSGTSNQGIGWGTGEAIEKTNSQMKAISFVSALNKEPNVAVWAFNDGSYPIIKMTIDISEGESITVENVSFIKGSKTTTIIFTLKGIKDVSAYIAKYDCTNKLVSAKVSTAKLTTEGVQFILSIPNKIVGETLKLLIWENGSIVPITKAVEI